MNSDFFITTLSRCFSDLECWTEGNTTSYDPFIRTKAQELEECIEIARGAYQHIRTNSLESLSSLSSREILALRQCLVNGLSLIMDDNLHRRIDECLKLLRRV
jgi:hypothetical protein